MYKLTIDDISYSCHPKETVLDALLREDVNIAYACKKGSCHSCLARSLDAKPPSAAQAGLKSTQKQLNHFLACQCYPDQDMTIRLPKQSEMFVEGLITVNEPLNRNTLLLRLTVPDDYRFNAGQFVNLQRPDGLTRSYSIANVPGHSSTLEFHIRRLPGGRKPASRARST